MIAFRSSQFSGTESSGVISATVIISGGITSRRDISVPVTFTPATATGYLNVSYNCDWIMENLPNAHASPSTFYVYLQLIITLIQKVLRLRNLKI